jgi:hypothetical protein
MAGSFSTFGHLSSPLCKWLLRHETWEVQRHALAGNGEGQFLILTLTGASAAKVSLTGRGLYQAGAAPSAGAGLGQAMDTCRSTCSARCQAHRGSHSLARIVAVRQRMALLIEAIPLPGAWTPMAAPAQTPDSAATRQ